MISSTQAQLKNVTFQSGYRTGHSDMINDFYIPCFMNSTLYDRAVGYFRSSVFIINNAIPNFVKRGGRIRIICSPYLTTNDIEALESGYKRRETIIESAINYEIDKLLLIAEIANEVEALATLIALNILDVKIAFRSVAQGIYHEKLGIFKDTFNNAVSFIGSSNETWNAWHENGNYESIEVFCSWSNQIDDKRISNHSNYFSDLWNGNVIGIKTYSFPQAAREKLYRVAKDDIDKVEWNNSKKRSNKTTRVPIEHQLKALTNWKSNNFKGILQHATGSGKTYTAILAIKEHVLSGNPALILVPSILLLRQWNKELLEEIPDLNILKAGDDNNRWKSNNLLRDFTTCDTTLKYRIVLSTIKTASTDLFLRCIASGDHLMVVIDEVHQAGSQDNSKVLSIAAGKKLGLSATPTRYGDPDGTKLLLDYFGGIIEPVVSLADAIRCGRLVPYEYYPHKVNLTKDEISDWEKHTRTISREIAKAEDDGNGNIVISDRIKLLYFKRSRILKKAKAKVFLAKKIINEYFKKGNKWLIYCEDSEQLNEILDTIRHSNFPIIEYHTAMTSDMDSTLEWFKKQGGILTSIRCLDEGIDIPDVTHALILASSRNPRQFIQRRGRILRKSTMKQFAVLHDAIVVPPTDEDRDEYSSIIRSEFCRAIEFSKGAINKSSSFELYKIAIDFGMDIMELSQIGFEEEK